MSTQNIDDYFLNRINKNLKKIQDLVNKEATEAMKVDARRIFNESIDEYYDGYSPKFYERKISAYDSIDDRTQFRSGGLYDLMTIEDNGDSSTLLFDSDNMNYDWNERRGSSPENESGLKEYLYKTTFRKGWHGGADKIDPDLAEIYGEHPKPGTPYYRTPYKSYKSWGNEAKREKTSPFNSIKKKAADYNNGEYAALVNNLLRKHIGHLLDP